MSRGRQAQALWLSAWVICAWGAALGQTSPAQGPLPVATVPSSVHEDLEIADYLALLQRIAPASEAGARNYLAAVRLQVRSRRWVSAALRNALWHGKAATRC